MQEKSSKTKTRLIVGLIAILIPFVAALSIIAALASMRNVSAAETALWALLASYAAYGVVLTFVFLQIMLVPEGSRPYYSRPLYVFGLLPFYWLLIWISPVFYPLRHSSYIWSNYSLDIFTMSVFAVSFFFLARTLALQKKKAKSPPGEKGRRTLAIEVAIAAVVLVLAGAVATDMAIPYVNVLHVVPDGQVNHITQPGLFGNARFVAVSNGTLHANISSDNGVTVYVLNNSEYNVLSNAFPPGSPVLPSNYTLNQYIFCTGFVSSTSFNISLGPGTYNVVMFNNNPVSATNVTVNSLTFSGS